MKPGVYYGYGLEIRQLGDMTLIDHTGSLPGVSSSFSFCPQKGFGVVVLCNTMDVSVGTIADAAVNYYCDLPVRPSLPVHENRTWSNEEMEELAGDYVSGEGDSFSLYISDGKLLMDLNGKHVDLIAVYPWQGIVRKKYSDVYLTAVRDEDGKVFAAQYGSRIFPKNVGGF